MVKQQCSSKAGVTACFRLVCPGCRMLAACSTASESCITPVAKFLFWPVSEMSTLLGGSKTFSSPVKKVGYVYKYRVAVETASGSGNVLAACEKRPKTKLRLGSMPMLHAPCQAHYDSILRLQARL